MKASGGKKGRWEGNDHFPLEWWGTLTSRIDEVWGNILLPRTTRRDWKRTHFLHHLQMNSMSDQLPLQRTESCPSKCYTLPVPPCPTVWSSMRPTSSLQHKRELRWAWFCPQSFHGVGPGDTERHRKGGREREREREKKKGGGGAPAWRKILTRRSSKIHSMIHTMIQNSQGWWCN